MMTSSNGNIFHVTGPLCGEFTGPGEFLAQGPVTRSFDVFFDLRLNKRLSKQSWGWWFETLSWSLWCQCNALCYYLSYVVLETSKLVSDKDMLCNWQYLYIYINCINTTSYKLQMPSCLLCTCSLPNEEKYVTVFLSVCRTGWLPHITFSDQLPQDLTDDKSTLVQVINGLVPSGNNPSPEPVLTKISNAIWCH